MTFDWMYWSDFSAQVEIRDMRDYSMAISSVMNVVDLLWTYLGMGTCVVIDLFQKREMGC